MKISKRQLRRLIKEARFGMQMPRGSQPPLDVPMRDSGPVPKDQLRKLADIFMNDMGMSPEEVLQNPEFVEQGITSLSQLDEQKVHQLREYVKHLLIESSRGGIGAQVAAAILVLKSGYGTSALVAPPGSSVPDVTILGGPEEIKIESKSSKRGTNVTPFDITCEDRPSCPVSKTFQPMIDAIIDAAIDVNLITPDDFKEMDFDGSGKIEFSEYVAASGGRFTPKAPEDAPPLQYTYDVVGPEPKGGGVELRGPDGSVTLTSTRSIKNKLLDSIGGTISLSHRISSSARGTTKYFPESDNKNVYIGFSDGDVLKQGTVKIDDTSSRSTWRGSGKPKLTFTGQFKKFGQAIFSSEPVREAAAQLWAQHLAEGGDNYISIATGEDLFLLGVVDDPLGLTGGKSLAALGSSAINRMVFGTYGSSRPDTMRAAPKLTLKQSVFTKIPKPQALSPNDPILVDGMITDNLGNVLLGWDGQISTWSSKN